MVNRTDEKKEALGLSYIRANEFTLRNETVEYIFQYGPELGYREEEIEEYLASFDRNFLKVFYEKAEAEDETSITGLRPNISPIVYSFDIFFYLFIQHTLDRHYWDSVCSSMRYLARISAALPQVIFPSLQAPYTQDGTAY